MKKQKRNTAIICLLVLMVLLTGCGKKEQGKPDAKENDDNTIDKMLIDSSTNMDENLKDEKEFEESIEDVIVDEPVKFECMDEIKEASPDSGLIQIDDMIIQYGSKFSDIAVAIEHSESIYEVEEYNVASVVPAGETLGIRFYKNGKQYFIIRVINCESETVELKDCVLYSISVLDEAIDNAYYAGFISNEMNYNTVKDLMKDYKPQKEIFGSDRKGNKELGVMYTMPFQGDEFHIYFIFDGVTNKLITFDLSSHKLDDVAWPW